MTPSILISYLKMPLGELVLGCLEDKLCLFDWRYRKKQTRINLRIQQYAGATFVPVPLTSIPIFQETEKQLDAYLGGDLQKFTIPFTLFGSDFQKSVWNALLSIPYGQTTTYMDMAKKLGDVQAIRAVAGANGANALSFIVPCHRVVGTDGALIGYAGGLAVKRTLLTLEQHQQQPTLF